MKTYLAFLLAPLLMLVCSTPTSTQADLPRLKVEEQTPAVLYEIKIPWQYYEDYPHIISQFELALEAWEEAVPVDFVVETIFDGDVISFDSVDLIIGDFNEMGISHPDGNFMLLGLYHPRRNTIYLSSALESWEEDRMEEYLAAEEDEARPPMEAGLGNFALHTSTHEVGHLLRCPHFVGRVDDDGVRRYRHGNPGDIILETDAEARTYLMYPGVTEEATGISEYEAELVTERLSIPRR